MTDEIRLPRAFPTRLQLLVGFSVLVAVLVVVLLLGLGQLLRDSIREAALSGAEQTGRVFAELELGAEEYKGGKLTDAAREDLGAAVDDSSTLQGVRVWGRDYRLVFSDDPMVAVGSPATTEKLRTALDGEIASDVSGDPPGRATDAGGARDARQLAIFVPIAVSGERRPRSVLELHLPYAPVQETIDRRERLLILALGLGGLLFYAALLPTVLRGSRALADLYQARQTPLQRRLRRAMRDDELSLAYQPKADLRTGRIEGVEALLRWKRPDGSSVPPGAFIPLVEPTAVMEPLTEHVFELALRQSAAWAQMGLELDVAVNISACSLQDGGLPDRLARQVAAHGLSPGSFTLEVTESGVSQGPEGDLETLTALRRRGFKLSIDDFGTGESSLSRIDLVDFEEIKIDRSFVRHLDEEGGGDPVLLANIIRLAQARGARVVAEGVESEAAARRLAELGCDVMQGFHLARPLAPEQLDEWLRASPAGRGGRERGVSATLA